MKKPILKLVIIGVAIIATGFFISWAASASPTENEVYISTLETKLEQLGIDWNEMKSISEGYKNQAELFTQFYNEALAEMENLTSDANNIRQLLDFNLSVNSKN